MFFTSKDEDIKSGRTTDVYFERTEEILKKLNKNPYVAVEVYLKKFPQNYSWGVLCGIEECIRLLEGIPSLNMNCMPEGTLFKEEQPVMAIEGKYLEFARLETPVLGFLCQSSGIATKAARCKIAAEGKTVFNFGARRAHPAITPMVERSAYIAGLDGVSTLAGAEVINQSAVGTMPHALILIIGDTVQAAKAFDSIIKKDVKRVSLIDTLGDEKFEAIRVCQELGHAIYALRLDTPGSRRGNFGQILSEIRWELDIRGFSDVKLMVSGGLDEEEIFSLRDAADSFGIGTAISGARVLDFSLDIVEIEGRKISKRGKMSGSKKTIRCSRCFDDKVVLKNEQAEKHICQKCGSQYMELFKNYIKEGKIIIDPPSPSEIRENVLSQLGFVKI
ncbi:MAG: nicotinate phosphoribosyltransferase [Actinobacteria bacterium]|nr:nicotinate phosphoribosyltransferase [Actinomycetota bacterium]